MMENNYRPHRPFSDAESESSNSSGGAPYGARDADGSSVGSSQVLATRTLRVHAPTGPPTPLPALRPPPTSPDDADALVLQQQWVTLTASMWPAQPTESPSSPSSAVGGAAEASARGWRVGVERLPVLAAVFCGAALVVCLVCALVIYRCCIMSRKEKPYCVRKVLAPRELDPMQNGSYPPHQHQHPHQQRHHLSNHNQSTQSASYAPPHIVNTAVYTTDTSIASAVVPVATHWGNGVYATTSSRSRMAPSPSPSWSAPPMVPPRPPSMQCTQCPGICPPLTTQAYSSSGCNGTVPRSTSVPGASQLSHSSSKRQRPVSQPSVVGLAVLHGSSCDDGPGCKAAMPLPDISEFSPQTTMQYLSSSILDEVGATRDDDASDLRSAALKTRSLPAWVRSKPRPLSTEDDLNDLYAKVNFSKKRKNRMCNDEAAIIALSKSRSQFLHKDTDSLVNNEAVIVYDERTAL